MFALQKSRCLILSDVSTAGYSYSAPDQLQGLCDLQPGHNKPSMDQEGIKQHSSKFSLPPHKAEPTSSAAHHSPTSNTFQASESPNF